MTKITQELELAPELVARTASSAAREAGTPAEKDLRELLRNRLHAATGGFLRESSVKNFNLNP